jgi:hypothetical protein
MWRRDAGAGRGGDAGKGEGAALGARRGDGRGGGVAGTDARYDAEGGADGAGRERGYSAGWADAEVVVVDDWKQLNALPAGAVKGKILLFNHKFDKELAAQGQGGI